MTYATRYVKSAVQTASRERTMVMLFEKAVACMRSGIAALDQSRHEQANRDLSRALDIVAHLQGTLNRPVYPDLCDNLSDLYLFVCLRLGEAKLRRSSAPAREAERVFAPVAQAFSRAVDSLAQAAP
ncbi:MAG TPA: flagellar export chaperone FliS [Anaeromyxobacteraceae bacterium]|nr:flagellar export chaperone FliS [Anaeromyxobacteraceae bacterium]